MQETILVIDFGTSNVRAVLFDAVNGDTLYTHSESYAMLCPEAGWQELDPNEVWENAVACVRGVMRQAAGKAAIRAISFSFIGASLFPLDEHYEPTYNCILCNDARAKSIALKMIPLFQTPTWKFSEVAPPSKMMWLRDNRPDVWENTRYCWTIQQFILTRLGLDPVYDPSVANLHYLYDQQGGGWRKDIFAYADLPEDMVICPVCPSEYIAGSIDHFGDVELGGSIPVNIGSQDGGLGMLGLGLLGESGDVIAEVSGTFDHVGFFANLDANNPIPGRCKPGPLAGTIVLMHVFKTYGADVEWFMNTFCGEGSAESYRDLWSHIDFDGSETKVLADPTFSGRGAFTGLDLSVTKYDLFKALIEALTFETRRSMEGVLPYKRSGCSRIRIGGGPTKEPAWAQLRADVTGKIIERVVSTDNSALGAAVLAAIGTGLYKDLPEASANLIRVKDVFYPDPEKHARYEELYRAYCARVFREAE